MKDFNELINELKESIILNYHKDDKVSEEIVEKIMMSYIRQCTIDSTNLGFSDFYKKYLNGMLVYDSHDFTSSEIMSIINETPLSDRDKEIAKLYYIELKSEEDIAYIVGIDKKTVHSNLPKISIKLKTTCSKLYGNK